MTRSLVSEIRTLYDVYASPDTEQKQKIIDLYNLNFDFVDTLIRDKLKFGHKEEILIKLND